MENVQRRANSVSRQLVRLTFALHRPTGANGRRSNRVAFTSVAAVRVTTSRATAIPGAAAVGWRFGLSGEPETLGEIGRRLGLSRERVRQIESAALARLREQARGSRSALEAFEALEA